MWGLGARLHKAVCVLHSESKDVSKSEEQQLEPAVVMTEDVDWKQKRRWKNTRQKPSKAHKRLLKMTSLICDQNFVNYNLLSFDLSELFCFSWADFRGTICL